MEIYGSAFKKKNLGRKSEFKVIKARGEAWVKASGLEDIAHCESYIGKICSAVVVNIDTFCEWEKLNSGKLLDV